MAKNERSEFDFSKKNRVVSKITQSLLVYKRIAKLEFLQFDSLNVNY